MAADGHFLLVPRGTPRAAPPAPARLPWWALALPALAFAALLAVVVATGGQHGPVAAAPPLADLAAHLRGLLPHLRPGR